MIAQDAVSVWLIRTDQPEPVVGRLEALLDEDERRRSALIADPVDRTEFVVSHGAVRSVLAGLLGCAPAALRWRRGRHGKPELSEPAADLRCNLSHSAGLAVLAVSAGRAVGVDVQRRQFAADLDMLAARYYPADEARFVAAGRSDTQRAVRFTGLWSRKEACVKAAGGRLIPGLRWPARGVDPVCGGVLVAGTDGRYLVRDLVAPPGYHLAVALAGSAPFRVVRKDWQLSTYPTTEPTAVDPC
jgi:4'-phosphopantetheinyl transferase